jgi:radical SAM protein with 4Fe4S-binding SPASM domain
MEPLTALARARNMHIEFPVTTNGTRLSRLRNDRFFELVSSVHITIEGDQPIHDRIRRTVDGHGSYSAILAGLARAVDKRIRIIVRVHENDLTGARFVRILDDLAGAGLRPDNATIYLTGAAPPISQSDLDQCRRHLGEHRLSLLRGEPALAASVHGHALASAIRWEMTRPTAPLPLAAGGCVFGGASSLAIDANGDIYKCPDDLRPSARIGVLGDDGIARWTARYFTLLASRWWRDGRACTECEWLPVCGAGCPLMPPPAALDDCSIRRQWFASSARHYVEHSLDRV